MRTRHVPPHFLDEFVFLGRRHPVPSCILFLSRWTMVDSHDDVEGLYQRGLGVRSAGIGAISSGPVNGVHWVCKEGFRSLVDDAVGETCGGHVIPAGEVWTDRVVEYVWIALGVHFLEEDCHLDDFGGERSEVGGEVRYVPTAHGV